MKTFLVNHQGVVYQKDLGLATTYLKKGLGVAAVVISTIATALLMLLLKLGRGAFCEMYATRFNKNKGFIIPRPAAHEMESVPRVGF